MTPTKSQQLETLHLLGEGTTFKDELCTMLEKTQIFSDLSHADINVLADYAQAYQAESGTTIFKEGEKGGYMYVVVDGEVVIYKDTDAREKKQIVVIKQGKTMGEMSLLDGMHYSATAVTKGETRIVMITRRNFDRMCERHPVLSLKILRKITTLMSLRLRRTTGVLVDYLE